MLTVTCTLFEPDERVKEISRVYDESWVEKLYRAVNRNLTLPHIFVCYVDRWREFYEPISQEFIPQHLKGMQKNLAPLQRIGRSIKFDLDNVIVGNIDDLVMVDAALAMPRDPNQPEKAISSPILTTQPIPMAGHERFRNEQDYLRILECRFFDDIYPGRIASYKRDVRRHGLGHASIVHFHGQPKMHEVDEDFVRDAWI